MKRVRILLGIALAVVLVTFPVAYGSQATPPAAPAAPGAPAPAQKALTEKTLTGQLVKVDTTAKTIFVKGADQKETSFSYNDDTQVISPEKTVQGLSGKTGAQLRISYHEERGANWATKIELMEKQ